MYLYSENHRKEINWKEVILQDRKLQKDEKVSDVLINEISLKNCAIVRFFPAVNFVFSYFKIG